jgi:tetratricopeptide (TPR) repeat protein
MIFADQGFASAAFSSLFFSRKRSETFPKEGRVVRSFIWINLAIVALAATGCALPPTNKTAQPAGNQASWTDKMTAPLKSLAPKKKPQPVVNAANPQVDPISLGFESGPATPALYVSMAQMSDQGGNAANARSLYQKALAIDSKNLDALLSLARLEDREGNLQLALQLYQQAVTFHPEDARALNDLALCHARCGQMQESLQLLTKAVQMRPEKPLYRNNIAKVLLELNQFEPAMAHLCAVNEPAVASYNMAALLHERGRTDEAIPFLQNAVALKPDMPQANSMLATLTGAAPANQAMASGLALQSPLTVSAPMREPARTLVTQVANNEITPTPYTAAETQGPAFSYPSTGVPPMIPRPQSVPSHTAQVPVGYEPLLLPVAR